jgi:hypothetical protein
MPSTAGACDAGCGHVCCSCCLEPGLLLSQSTSDDTKTNPVQAAVGEGAKQSAQPRQLPLHNSARGVHSLRLVLCTVNSVASRVMRSSRLMDSSMILFADTWSSLSEQNAIVHTGAAVPDRTLQVSLPAACTGRRAAFKTVKCTQEYIKIPRLKLESTLRA